MNMNNINDYIMSSYRENLPEQIDNNLSDSPTFKLKTDIWRNLYNSIGNNIGHNVKGNIRRNTQSDFFYYFGDYSKNANHFLMKDQK